MANFDFPARSGLSHGSLYTDGSYTWMWYDAASTSRVGEAVDAGYWKKVSATTRDTGLADQWMVYSDGGLMAGTKFVTYDKVDNTLTVQRALPADGITQGYYLLEIRDLSDNDYNSILGTGLYPNEVDTPGVYHCREQGQWVPLPAGSATSTVFYRTTTPTANLTNDLWFKWDPTDVLGGDRSINIWDGSAWDTLLEFPVTVSVTPIISGTTASTLAIGSTQIEGHATTNCNAYLTLNDNGTVRHYLFAGAANEARWIRTAPSTQAHTKITGAAALDAFQILPSATGTAAMTVRDNADVYDVWQITEDTIVGNGVSESEPTITMRRDSDDGALVDLAMYQNTSITANTPALRIDTDPDTHNVQTEAIRVLYPLDHDGTIDRAAAICGYDRDFAGYPVWKITKGGAIYINPPASTISNGVTKALDGDWTALDSDDLVANFFTGIVFSLPSNEAWTIGSKYLEFERGGERQASVDVFGNAYFRAVEIYSDASLKTGIAYHSSTSRTSSSATMSYRGLDTINALSPASFTFTDDSTERLGFIADDVVKVGDGLAFQDDNGTYAVDLGAIVATLTNAVQELSSRLETVEAALNL